VALGDARGVGCQRLGLGLVVALQVHGEQRAAQQLVQHDAKGKDVHLRAAERGVWGEKGERGEG
jgi:hypothetical protein